MGRTKTPNSLAEAIYAWECPGWGELRNGDDDGGVYHVNALWARQRRLAGRWGHHVNRPFPGEGQDSGDFFGREREKVWALRERKEA